MMQSFFSGRRLVLFVQETELSALVAAISCENTVSIGDRAVAR